MSNVCHQYKPQQGKRQKTSIEPKERDEGEESLIEEYERMEEEKKALRKDVARMRAELMKVEIRMLRLDVTRMRAELMALGGHS